MTPVRFFFDLALRAHQEMDSAAAVQSESYAAAVFDDRGQPESAAMVAEGDLDVVRWYAERPSERLHARHISRYGAVEYSVVRGEPAPGGDGFMRTIWEMTSGGDIHRRDVFLFASHDDDRIVEAWRYGPDDTPCHHYVYENGKLVSGEEYLPDGTLDRTIGEE